MDHNEAYSVQLSTVVTVQDIVDLA